MRHEVAADGRCTFAEDDGAGRIGWRVPGAPCSWRAQDGCQDSIGNLVITGDTMVSDAAVRLWFTDMDDQRGRRANDHAGAFMVIVLPDLTGGREEFRLDTGQRPDQLQLSTAGDGIALSCNALYVCDLPRGDKHNESRMIVNGAHSERLWCDGIPDQEAPPDADGRAFDPALSAFGGIVFAHLAFAAANGNLIVTRQPPFEGPTGRLATTATKIAGTGVTLPSLPPHVTPLARPKTALLLDSIRALLLDAPNRPLKVTPTVLFAARPSGRRRAG